MDQRLEQIADAAASLFLRQGYSRTQMSHIARAAGVSVGALYLDFTGKRAILNFVLKRAIDPEVSQRELPRPITDDLFPGLEGEIEAAFRRSAEDFGRHLTDGADYSFEDMLSDAFDMLARYAVGCLFIEKNQFDFPGLTELYREHRTRFFQTVTGYLRRFVEEGTVRPLDSVDLTASLIIELLTCWAMDARYTAFEPLNLSLEQAKALCLDNLLSAYGRKD